MTSRLDASLFQESPKLLYREVERLIHACSEDADGARFLIEFYTHFWEQVGSVLGVEGLVLYAHRADGLDRFHSVGTLREELPDAVEVTGDASWLTRPQRTVRWSLVVDNSAVERPGRDAPLFGTVLPGERWHSAWLSLSAEADPALVELCVSVLHSELLARLAAGSHDRDLEAAREIQEALLGRDLPALAGYDIAGASRPAEVVGGDFYDVQRLHADALTLAVGDASGHGLPAALMVRDVVTGLRVGVHAFLRAEATLRSLQYALERNSLSSRFVSLFFGELEENGNLFYFNLGHEPPLYVHEGRSRELMSDGTVLGPVQEPRMRRHHWHMDAGSTLLAFTDGITERRGAGGDFFGVERLHALLVEHPDATAAELVERVLAEATAFGDDAPWEDDATVLVVRRLPKE